MRFEREARALASLNHPNIAAIYGLEQTGPPGESEQAPQAIVMELVEGQDLSEWIAGQRRSASATAAPGRIEEVLRIARQIADALDAAHEKGIVHRDLKPANVKITPGGVVKVLDFGLAKTRADVSAADLPIATTVSAVPTESGSVMGTAPYMSPEQARGQSVDKREDIWAFGCVLYEMLTGQRAFRGETMADVLAGVIEREPDRALLPAATPAAVCRLIQRCLEKNPTRRLRDIGDARVELDDPSQSSATVAGSARPRWSSRALAVSAIVIGLAAIAIVAWDRPFMRPTPSARGLGPRLSRVTWDDSFSTEPALSRDGTLVAYASDRAGDGQLDLWLQPVAGGEPRRLTFDPADDRAPDFSPDGRLIAFRSDRAGGGVYVMSLLGGDARLVAESGRSPRYSPDGSRIAYWTGPWLGGALIRTGGSAVFTVSAMSGQPPTRIAGDFVAAINPVWSPDGQRLVFFGGKGPKAAGPVTYDWWVAPAAGGDPVATGVYPLLVRTLEGTSAEATPASALQAVPEAWTRDGIAFSVQLGESINLWRVRLSETSGMVIDGSLERVTTGAGFDDLASADLNGRLAFRVSNESLVSLLLPLDPNAPRAIGPIRRVTTDSGSEFGRNSLDEAGRLLAFTRRRARETELWVKNLATEQERHIVTTPPVEIDPIMSPDGARIAYSMKSSSYLVLTAGGTSKVLCDQCTVYGWFGDSRRILVGRPAEGKTDARLMAFDVIAGTATDVLVAASGGFARADVTREGGWVAFQNQRRVLIAPVRPGHPPASTEWHVVLTIPADAAERACGWSPDGRLLYLLLERDGFRDLYAQRIDPALGTPVGDPQIVQHLHDPRHHWGSTPLGTAIVSNAFVFNQVEATGSIWLLDPGGTGAAPAGVK